MPKSDYLDHFQYFYKVYWTNVHILLPMIYNFTSAYYVFYVDWPSGSYIYAFCFYYENHI